MTQIYQFFGKSCTRTQKLKDWQDFFAAPELKFKRIFTIRWSTIRDCIRPIIVNTRSGNFSSCFRKTYAKRSFRLESPVLFACLQQIISDPDVSKHEHTAAQALRDSILDDEFLFLLHMNHDLHELVMGRLITACNVASLTSFHIHTSF